MEMRNPVKFWAQTFCRRGKGVEEREGKGREKWFAAQGIIVLGWLDDFFGQWLKKLLSQY